MKTYRGGEASGNIVHLEALFTASNLGGGEAARRVASPLRPRMGSERLWFCWSLVPDSTGDEGDQVPPTVAHNPAGKLNEGGSLTLATPFLQRRGGHGQHGTGGFRCQQSVERLRLEHDSVGRVHG